MAIVTFIYMTLDNCDGKQARKTGNSSALGLLFDHGLDCLVAGLQPILVAHILNYSVMEQFIFVFALTATFYLITYES